MKVGGHHSEGLGNAECRGPVKLQLNASVRDHKTLPLPDDLW
jgi:hypothetical protein